MNTTINYQPWLQAVLTVAKHYRIEPSEERIRLELNWNKNQTVDDALVVITRQIGLSIRKVDFSADMLNPWRLPVLVGFIDGQVGVIEKADAQGNVSIQLSGDQGLAQTFSAETLSQVINVA